MTSHFFLHIPKIRQKVKSNLLMGNDHTHRRQRSHLSKGIQSKISIMKVFLLLCLVTVGLASPSRDPRCNDGGCPTTDPPGPLIYCPQCVTDQCSIDMCNLAVMLPFPHDCNKYCVCDNNGAIQMSCPAGLVFDPTLSVCTWPESSSCCNDDFYQYCDAVPTTTTTTTTPPPTTCTTTTTTQPPTTCTTTTTTTTQPPTTCTTTTLPPTTCTTTTQRPTTDCTPPPPPPCTTEAPRPLEYCPACVNGRCDPGMCNLAVGVNYPHDCSRFCICSTSGAIAMDCPAGLVFEATLGVCVWPDQSSCQNSDPYPEC
ncbi:hypothetical protein B566_EDAN013390 [Ephemera danica]|nr:hypothetical protein B566_EDAN013390 [Ephemera danica]